MKKITNETARKLLKKHEASGSGKIFSLRWRKKNGEVAERTLKFGVKIGLTGVGAKYDPASKDLLWAWDMAGHRVTVDLKTLMFLTLDGVTYEITEKKIINGVLV